MNKKTKWIMSVCLCFFLIWNMELVINAQHISNKNRETESVVTDVTPIMGESSVTIGQLVNFYQMRYRYPDFYANTEAPNIYEFCRIYMEECAKEGVRVEVAFCQSMKETGYLQYPGDVTPDQYNFAGLDTTGQQSDGSVEKGRSYPSVRIGIRAHVQRLKAYASKGITPESYKSTCIDSDKFTPWWKKNIVGSAPYVEWLGKSQNPNGFGWATDPNYGYSIVNDYMSKLLAASDYTTWYQGVDYSAVYDPDYYLRHNSDVSRAYDNNGEKAIAHFVTYGMKEGRQGNAVFSIQSYKNQYADLRRAFGNNLKSYYLHYINCGQSEGRIAVGCTSVQNAVTSLNGIDYAAVYDYNYYVSRYSDIKRTFGTDDLAVLQHFVACGMKEGRQGKESFSVQSYSNQYADLRRAFGSNWKSYYLHYINYGVREGRLGTGCMSMQNPTTVYQGVDYAAVYDYNYYINKYGDIKKAFGGREDEALQHFVIYGMKEGRQATENFCVQNYKNQYQDLQNAFGDDLKSYYNHYIRYGKNEGRTAK